MSFPLSLQKLNRIVESEVTADSRGPIARNVNAPAGSWRDDEEADD